jgi:hypothetical protein
VFCFHSSVHSYSERRELNNILLVIGKHPSSIKLTKSENESCGGIKT